MGSGSATACPYLLLLLLLQPDRAVVRGGCEERARQRGEGPHLVRVRGRGRFKVRG